MSSALTERPRRRRRFRLLGAVFAAVAFAAGLSAVALVESSSTPASAAVTSFAQCNAHGPGPAGAPLVETCEVTIENTGDTALSGVVVTDTRTGNFDSPFPTTLAPGSGPVSLRSRAQPKRVRPEDVHRAQHSHERVVAA